MVSGVSLNQVNPYQAVQPRKEDKNIGRKIGGVIAGGAIYQSVPLFQTPFAIKCINKMQKINGSLAAEESVKVSEALQKTLEMSGLKDRGVEIVKASSRNSAEVTELLTKEMGNGFIAKLTPNRVKQQIEGAREMVERGCNAAYLSKSNKILMPDGNKFALAGFHEAGHAMNANLNKATKILQKSRKATILALPIIAIGLLKKPKAEGEKPQGIWDKATTFIQKNAGVLTAATFLPTIAEEGLATLKGNQYAKKLLSPDLAKKVANSNRYGLATYVAMAGLFGLAAHLGVKVKNAIAHPELNKEKVQNC
ncbi:hypothetical protein IJI31_01460 [bacterium]|nr:hypothetical protein [bacterium]